MAIIPSAPMATPEQPLINKIQSLCGSLDKIFEETKVIQEKLFGGSNADKTGELDIPDNLQACLYCVESMANSIGMQLDDINSRL